MDEGSQPNHHGLNPLRLLFCGTPNFAVPTLKHLLAQPDFAITAVITQPDRPRGRGQEVSFSPVKETALAASVPVFQPEKIRTPESEQFLREANPDAIVIIAYGQIIPARLLNIPKLGWINSHASLLPKYRGAAPIQWAIANNETKTGITTMRIDAGMDTGDMLLQRETPIASNESTPELAARLAEISAPVMAETLRGLRDGILHPTPQDHSKASTAPLLKKEDGRINWNLPAQTTFNRMRAFTPWPGAYTLFRGATCHLLFTSTATLASPEQRRLYPELRSGCAADEAPPGIPQSGTPAALSHPAAPGTILYDGRELLVSCGEETLLVVSRVKVEGRREVSALEFANGTHLQSGEHFR
jgi:methionyl-tRNA formyltransferase